MVDYLSKFGDRSENQRPNFCGETSYPESHICLCGSFSQLYFRKHLLQQTIQSNTLNYKLMRPDFKA